MKKKILLFVSIVFLFTESFAADFPASHQNVDYVGRVLKADDGSVSFDWVGVYFRFRFTGDRCSMKVSDTRSSYFMVFVDGEFSHEINTRGGENEIELASGLRNGVHSVMVYKRTEAGEGKTTVKSFSLAGGANLLSWIDAPRRRIEFIGNSITCGFGVETTDPDETYTPETENSYRSYASLTARAFNADCMLTAHSGQGVVRNYGDPKPISDYTMLQRFTSVFDMEPEPLWDFKKWQPDAVVINLGTNDFSTQPHPSEKDFMDGYTKLISLARKAYGDIPIFCLSSPMSGETQRKCVEEVVAQAKSGNLYFVPMYNHALRYPDDYGAGHPNYKGQKKLAMLLIPYMSSVMGWEVNLLIN